MARASLAALSLGMIFFVGCGSSEIADLRASVEKHKQSTASAKAAAAIVKNDSAKTQSDAQQKLAYAEHLMR